MEVGTQASEGWVARTGWRFDASYHRTAFLWWWCSAGIILDRDGVLTPRLGALALGAAFINSSSTQGQAIDTR